MLNVRSSLRNVTVMLLALLLAACATPQPQPPVVVQPPSIPPLPQEARQRPAPDYCSPTCSSAVAKDLSIWRESLTKAAGQEASANGSTTNSTNR